MAPGGSSGPPKFDGRNFAYWKARMESYIEAQSVEAWEVTSKPIGGAPTESQAKWNARAKNYLFEAISEEVFSRVHSKATAHEIWLEIDKIHNDSKKVCEEKYQVLNEKLNDFRMLPNELGEQMYSRLNVLF